MSLEVRLLPEPKWDWQFYRKSISVSGEGTFFLEKIRDACRWESFIGFLIVGREGSGKSMLGLKILRAVYGSWRTALGEVYFRWQDLEKELDTVNKIGAVKPAVLWDDAGIYAGRYLYRTDYETANRIAVLTQLIREHTRALIMTAPNPEDVSKILRVRTGWYVCRLRRASRWQSSVRCLEMDTQFFGRRGRRWVAGGLVDIRVPDDVYVEYRGMRRKYYMLAKEDLENRTKRNKRGSVKSTVEGP